MSNEPLPEDLVPEASAYVYRLFKERLPEGIYYHTYDHTVEMAEAAARIARKSNIGKGRVPLVELAAWFHDVGFIQTYEGHEDASVRIAAGFLEARGLSDTHIAQVASLIQATRAEHVPQDLAEAVIHDADLVHTGKKSFTERSERLRREWEIYKKQSYTDQEWTEIQLQFLNEHPFLTAFAREEYGKRRSRNLMAIQRRLGALLNQPLENTKEKARRDSPERGIETMFRSSYRNHINLSSIADSKANIMISVNAILMSIIISFVSSRLQANPWLMIPSACLLITSLVAIVFAVLSTRPKVTSQVYTLEDVRQNRSNILFFGNFVNMPVTDFNLGMRELMQDADRLYDNMISDIYSLGKVLSQKYHLLWYSYTVFMVGLSVSVILFLILFFVS